MMIEDDDYVFNIIMKNKDKLEEKYYKLFTTPYNVVTVTKDDDYDFHFVKLKVRYFDPTISHKNRMHRLSEIDKGFNNVLKEKLKHFEAAKEGLYFKVNFI